MNGKIEDSARDDWLERALQSAGREHRLAYIADDGFTAAVVGRLPEPAKVPAWRRPVVALLWLFAGIAVMISLPGLFDQVFRGAVAMLVSHRLGAPDVIMALLLLAGVTWSALVYAARTE